MHELNVVIIGPSSFTSTLNELKSFLKFNSSVNLLDDYSDVVLFHYDALKDERQKKFIDKFTGIKICASEKKRILDKFDGFLELPASLNEVNTIIDNIVVKKKFSKNSSLRIKNYLLNKNEKKLIRDNNYTVLTEKEVQLLELFLNTKKPISKNFILSSVWNYSSDADTHTVETHIYRLRKKINDKFADEKFILNNKDGYYL